MSKPSMKIADYPITKLTCKQVIQKALNTKKTIVINTINAHSYVTAQNDKKFSQALQSSDILLPDGISMVVARAAKQRISGPDFFEAFNRVANKQHLRYFFLGSNKETLKKIQQRLNKEHPNITATFHAPGMYPFSEQENNQILHKIKKAKPDILWVGMTAPKQEKWVFDNKSNIQARITVPIGAAFDFYAGTVQRAPAWMRNNGLEWLHRFASNPRAMAHRYITNNIKFAYYLVTQR